MASDLVFSGGLTKADHLVLQNLDTDIEIQESVAVRDIDRADTDGMRQH